MNREDVQKYNLPDTPGVYFFIGRNKQLLYIGKATSLKDRVRSYFNTDILKTRGPLLEKTLQQALTIDWRTTDSVLEALILEAALIKKHQPIGNTKEKDNRSFNYIVLTNEAFPRVLVVRGRDLLKTPTSQWQKKAVFGPFPQGSKLKEALKIIRKIFPFRDTCTPPTRENALNVRKPCFNAQIGLCPGVCTGSITKKEYARTIQHLSRFLHGDKESVVRNLTKEMNMNARAEQFERAQKIKKQLYALQHIRDVALVSNHDVATEQTAMRIESYDVAHMSETSRVGVMVVIQNGTPHKNEYRKFIIKDALPGDTHALAEVLLRRLAHSEWRYPHIVVVDGSTAQINTAKRIFASKNLSISVVGVVKDERHRPKNIKWPKELLGQTRTLEQSVLLANAEAHRFAIGFYRRKARKKLIQ